MSEARRELSMWDDQPGESAAEPDYMLYTSVCK